MSFFFNKSTILAQIREYENGPALTKIPMRGITFQRQSE